MSTTEFSTPPGKSRVGIAFMRSLRVTADLARRWFEENPGPAGCAAARTHGVLVVFASGDLADRIEGELLRAGLLEFVQTDDKVRPRA